MRYLFIIVFFACCNRPVRQVDQLEQYREDHRLQVHFSPRANWMNDPNGLVFHNGTYHLFFQYYPDSTVWGPMHWGHATSKDLVHWTEEEIALYPDSLGYIFSGSAVSDIHNTSGLGKNGKTPLVVLFTYHDPVGEKAGRDDFQSQGLAYSLDDGRTWTKYEKNPVLTNPGIRDFRDPKILWYEPGNKWIMTLATRDRITFYSSPDLKRWSKESEFGETLGAHGGVWECPDLIPFNHHGDTVWVLLVSINPGGPNGGSATQYFTGQFDGKYFTPGSTDTMWLDYGPDNYAGVTWSNVGDRKLFIGWMSNWQYANLVPTAPWRSAMTIPRDLGISRVGNRIMVSSLPARELEQLHEKEIVIENVNAKEFDLTARAGKLSGPVRLKLRSGKIEDYSIVLSNQPGEQLILGYDKNANQYFIDRKGSGKTGFEIGFAQRYTAPRIAEGDSTDLELVIDNGSVEMFADGGLSVMTALFFPNEPYTKIQFTSSTGFMLERLEFVRMKSAWRKD